MKRTIRRGLSHVCGNTAFDKFNNYYLYFRNAFHFGPETWLSETDVRELKWMPLYSKSLFLVRQMVDDAATVLMVDSNLQRENILPSERAFAYKMKLEALKRQGARTDLTSAQLGRKLEAADIVGQETCDSRNQVRRYILLTNLIPELLEMVDQ